MRVISILTSLLRPSSKHCSTLHISAPKSKAFASKNYSVFDVHAHKKERTSSRLVTPNACNVCVGSGCHVAEIRTSCQTDCCKLFRLTRSKSSTWCLLAQFFFCRFPWKHWKSHSIVFVIVISCSSIYVHNKSLVATRLTLALFNNTSWQIVQSVQL